MSTSNGLAIVDAATLTVMTTVPALGGGFEFIGPRFPGVSLTLNGTSFKPGDPFVLTATTYAGDRTGPVDASYAWRAYFTEPGTSNVVGLVAQARFTVGP